MSSKRRDVILAGIASFFAWSFAVSWIPSLRWATYAFVIGLVLPALGLIVLLLFTSRRITLKEKRSIRRPGGAAFLAPALWSKEIVALKARQEYKKQLLYTDSETISDVSNEVLNFIARDFINSWYSGISKSPVFMNEVDKVIRVALVNLRDRLLALDFATVLIARFVPILTAHFREYYNAERAVRGKYLNRTVTESEELDLAIAAKYNNGKVHPAVCLSYSDTKLLQQNYLRSVIKDLLPQLLPESCLASRASSALINELVVCTILTPTIQLLAEPDTWNQILESYGRSMLQDRSTVKKLRFALDQHASLAPKTTRGNIFPRLAPGDHERRFERFLRAIRKLNNVSEARRFRSEISSQLKKESSHVKDPVYLRRLEIGKRLLDQRVNQLALGRDRSFDIQRTPSNAITRLENASLVDILHDTAGLTYFMEYMDRQNLLSLVQFWIVVDGFRTPLEGDFADDDINTSCLSHSETDRRDLAQIYDSYFSKQELNVSDVSRRIVREFLKSGKDASPKQYHLARKEILKAQTATLDVMQEKHFQNFKKSDLFYKCLTSQEVMNVQMQLSPEFPAQKDHFLPRVSSSPMLSIKDPIVSRAPSRTSSNSEQLQLFINSSLDMTNSTKDLRKSLFEDEDSLSPHSQPRNINSSSGLFHQKRANYSREKPEKIEKPNISSLGLVNISSRIGVFKDDDLFPDEEKFMSDEHEDPEEDELDQDDEVHEAAPGDLGLAEAIMALNIDIERLEAQDAVIDSMTRKAELTNNTAELRILKKSKTSLQREIRRKELQRRQYVVQESDNSLYGRSTIKIKSVLVGKEDDGREYAVYVIEIQRKAGEQIPAATWTITRRYSEFHELHQRLREKYTSIRNSNFPRRRMVMKLQTDFLQKRRQALENYLREILLLPEVCRSIELRTFLSESASTPGGDSFHENDENKKDLVTRLYNSITDGMEDIFGSRAVVVVLHQLLGGTIERKVRENIKGLFSEDSLVRYIGLLRDSIWPDGELKMDKKPRTSAQKVKSKAEASFMLATLVPDLAASVVGRVNAQAASRRIFATLNNPRLNVHLVFTLFDEIIDIVFNERGN
ncbi:Structural protein MDM1 [Erysiphe neolycopersici]|uniref:Structural protein MDM1 n=1 Tax=Erysiphe neolycopersici TaxID=212602 RepID=A0A420HQ83_9PEZI|nr:Structural protein MDM1 [Erysiphe neolycopersici]